MKKVIKLNESDLIRIIKRVILEKEEENTDDSTITIGKYTLTIVDTNIKITKNNKSETYEIYYIPPIGKKLKIDVLDFPGGKKIKALAKIFGLEKEMELEIDSKKVEDLLDDKFENEEVNININIGGYNLLFTKIK